MKLRSRTIYDFRGIIEKELKGVNKKDDKKIKINKDLLEMLLFKTITIDGTIVKVPVWTDYFLKEIDLSEVNTDNIMFDRLSVNFRNTNIKIDFSKAYWGEATTKILKDHDFAGVDLSNSNIDIIDSFEKCDFSNTNIKIDSLIKFTKFYKCNLEGVDLSKVTVSVGEFFGLELNTNQIANTGLKLVYNPKRDKGCSGSLSKMIELGRLSGCYVNDVKILSEEEKKQIKEEKQTELSSLEEKARSYVLKTINDYKKSN